MCDERNVEENIWKKIECIMDERNTECIQNFDGEDSQSAFTWKTERKAIW
jgi:hypothetical protein